MEKNRLEQPVLDAGEGFDQDSFAKMLESVNADERALTSATEATEDQIAADPDLIKKVRRQRRLRKYRYRNGKMVSRGYILAKQRLPLRDWMEEVRNNIETARLKEEEYKKMLAGELERKEEVL